MVDDNGISTSSIGCPQCGARVRVPHNADTVRCAFCRSALVLARGVLVHLLRERVALTREQAVGMMEAWLKREDYAPASVRSVGELRSFPFLRVTKHDDELVIPLADPPSPAVALLGNAPAEFHETESPAEGLDRDELDAGLSAALADLGTTGLRVEERCYYPVEFTTGDSPPLRCSAIVDAGQGTVYPDALPQRSRRTGSVLSRALLALVVVLVAEAVLIPSLWLAIVVIVLTAAAFWGFALWKGATAGA